MFADVRYALRIIVKNPAFSAVAVLSLTGSMLPFGLGTSSGLPFVCWADGSAA